MNRKSGSIRLLLFIVFIFAMIIFSTWAVSININNNFLLNTEQENEFYDFQNNFNLKSSQNGIT
ncbi:MAG: hypothetical protein ACFE8G_05480, partial [Candidatus Hermodarchaeota archaeon]